MVKKKVHKNAKTIELKANSDKEFFLIHGYTGSPTDFNGLPKILHKKFNANIKIIRLKGHGEDIESLDNIDYDDFYKQVEKDLIADIRKGRKIVIGGVSFGSCLSFELSAKYPVVGVFNAMVPYKLKFPFNIKGIGLMGIFKKYWKKRINNEEKKFRKNSFNYSHMHTKGLKMVMVGKERIDKYALFIEVPYLSIHTKKDPIGNFNGEKEVLKKIKSKIKKSFLLKGDNHNVFFSNENKKVYSIIIDFFKENKVFEKR